MAFARTWNLQKKEQEDEKTTLGLAKEKTRSGTAREDNSHSILNRQSHWYLYCYKLGKMVANLPRHSTTLQRHTTGLHKFNKQDSIFRNGKWMSWSRRGRGKAAGKISFLRLSNFSGPSLKTKESNILECWRRFKNVAFYAWPITWY